ncbi:MAG: hypothetical protein ABR597_06315 [Bacteroidales bacterium]
MTHKKIICVFLFGLWGLLSAIASQAGNHNAGNISLRGYMKTMPGMRLNKKFSDPDFHNLVHNRLNVQWNITKSLQFVVEGRNRVFYNTIFDDFPIYADILDNDDGLIDLSWVWLNKGAWIGHTEIDRLYMDYRYNNWQMRAGRQRINWGINLVSNPNDLFNTYSFFDFDYEERPGADALRVQYHTGFAGRVEIAYKPSKRAGNSVAAFLWSTNYKGYDLQAIAGYYKNRSALGMGWAGNIGGAGFKGEATWFYDLQETNGNRNNNLVAATGLDYMFGGGTFAVLEFLYNGGYKPMENMFLMLDQPLSPDNIMFSEYAITMSLQHPFSPIFSGSLALMALPDQESFFLMPQASWSLVTNLDLNIISQIFLGSEESIFSDAGSAWYMSLKYSF